MSIESITDKIRSEAEAYAADQKAQAEGLKNEALNDARRQADAVIAKFKNSADTDAAVLKSRRQSVADLDARKMKLAAKQEVIEEVYAAAIEKLQSLSPEDYIKFIKDQLADFKDDEGEILLNAKDKEQYGAQLADAFSGSKLTVSEETASIQGGCILKKGNISYNASIEKLLDNVKNEVTSEIAGILFKEA